MPHKGCIITIGIIVVYLIVAIGISWYEHNKPENVVARKEAKEQAKAEVKKETETKRKKRERKRQQAAKAVRHRIKGWEYINSGKPFKAITEFDTTIRLTPDDESAYLGRAIAKADLMQYEASIADCKTAIIQSTPDDVIRELNKEIEAARIYTETHLVQYRASLTIKLLPEGHNSRRIMGKSYLWMGKTIRNIYERKHNKYTNYYTSPASERSASWDQAYREYHQSKNRLYDAEVYLDAAIKLDLESDQAYCERGRIRAARGFQFEAIADYDTAIRLNPNNPYPYVFRGMEKRVMGRALEAKQDYQIGLKLGKDDEKLKELVNALMKM